jgi:phosphatidate phosphatase APP1
MTESGYKHTEKKPSLWGRFKRKLLGWLRLSDHPVIRVYNSYGNETHIIIHGHVLAFSPMPRKRYRKFFVTNTLAVLRLFMVKPFKGVTLTLNWLGTEYESCSETDGFFRFEIPTGKQFSPGWYEIEVFLKDGYHGKQYSAKGEVYFPYPYQYTFISDIDDTFLISHSSRLRRRLYVLFTKNARTRKPFLGVAEHYRELAANNAAAGTYNPFFYVSSSEWNLYSFLVEFLVVNRLPKGILLLNQLKTFSQVLQSGQNKHATKFFRIVRILEAYPNQQYILLGDDSQEDPNIYLSVVQHFPGKIKAVYLRNVRRSRKTMVELIVGKIESAGVSCCYFVHSAEAIEHSKAIGLTTNR